MKKLMLSVVAAVLTVIGLGGIASISPVYAGGPCPDGTKQWSTSYTECFGDDLSLNDKTDLTGLLTTIINVVIGVVGFIAVIMMILGGISFITSQGDAAKVTKAKNTILYGVVGLIVAMLAFAIVNFVLGAVFK